MMELILFLVVFFLWVFVGQAGYVYWWTREFDFKADNIAHCVLVSIAMGPLTWFFGVFIHGEEFVVFKKAKRGETRNVHKS